MQKIISLLLIVLLMGTLLSGCAEEATPEEHPPSESAEEATPAESAERTRFIDEEISLLDGGTVKITDYEGQYVFMTFWATWCSYCKVLLPALDEVASERDDVAVLAIDVNEDPEDVAAFVEEAGYSFDVALDEEGAIASAFGITGFPTTYLFDPEGNNLGYFPGAVPKEKILEILESKKSQ